MQSNQIWQADIFHVWISGVLPGATNAGNSSLMGNQEKTSQIIIQLAFHNYLQKCSFLLSSYSIVTLTILTIHERQYQ